VRVSASGKGPAWVIRLARASAWELASAMASESVPARERARGTAWERAPVIVLGSGVVSDLGSD
jgi:hypothetical protein